MLWILFMSLCTFSRSVSVENNEGNIITDPEEVRERWKQYTEALHDKDGKPKLEDIQVEEEEKIGED